MTDTSDQSEPAEVHHPDLDVDAETKHLDDIGHHIDDARYHAKEDLEVGHAGRMFADAGTEREMEAADKEAADKAAEGDDRSP